MAHSLEINSLDFVRRGEQMSGQMPIGRFTRLLEGLLDQELSQQEGGDGLVHWSLGADRHFNGRQFLLLSVKTDLVLECQRCLKPFIFHIDANNRLELVRSEKALDSEEFDQDLEDEPPEKILASSRLNVLDLVEDELILAIPYVPRHDVCPDANEASTDDEEIIEKRPSPFAVLEQLKKQ